MRRNSVFLGAMICLTMMAVGCGSGTEGPQPTVTVSPTAAVITESPTPTEAVVGIPEGLPIDIEHFGDEAFCEFLMKEFDSDGNGYLSKEEREAARRSLS